MIKAIIFDFSRTLLFPVDENYKGGLNDLYRLVKDEVDFNFNNYFYLNKSVLDAANKLKNSFKLYIFTTETIQEDPQIKNEIEGIFSKVFSAKSIGYNKKNIKSYQFIIDELGLKPEEIVFIDDSTENLLVAREAGITTIMYEGFEKFIQKLQELGVKF
ncbi:hypothetical protein A2130_02370 [Candidatus Woesebacteria bacterium GWC2_33_12]|uniref:HAD-superfamily hydrolase, subfamily IA, variant 3 n=1 Tax=Candidatus Woesebacteria bacterium GW2011_GWB1_33_22 TaxID=1618566 RepID=A0A0F9ZMN2_9BACT|nr:MAG: hypothetical protein UR29_C0006G0013 [Candidatus Woesebacteria bacterium GW2011_GWC2_33_12]KKP42802.1 MAG: hypothetical protein UR33_C0001G0163 [Candidatus Woesebacteria bacterium GW2011_GWA2_33_20]KKP45424.1 MAG: hypothetical protein UR35_C0001G0021 [Candidatus Woesebacteria bacterium GW2011_GWB1_33_22]KKP46265.1 MAG: seg [Microgenomates group bacterium GW2011_GWC1_33_28]KKP50374.1 MAG: hypothetical protein UR41_C0009G0021 [Candidatus Woesebacteria bacterium GW2011_GWA1_33_33]OGM07868